MHSKNIIHSLAILLAMAILLPCGLLPAPASAQGGTFPAEPFNGMQITYSISGATITDTKDTAGFTTSRALKGTLGTGQLTLSGSGKMGSGYSADLVATVSCGGKSDEFKANIKSGFPDFNSESFNLSVAIPQGSTSGSFSIRMTGHYNAGDRGLVVSGTFAGDTSSATDTSPTAPTQKAEDPPPGPLVDKLPEADLKSDKYWQLIAKVEGNPIYVSADSPELPPSQRKWVKIMPGDYTKKNYIVIGEHWTVRTPSGAETTISSRTGCRWQLKERSWFESRKPEIQTPSMSVVFGRLYEGIANFYFPKGVAGAKKFEVGLNRVHTGIKGTNFIVEVNEQSDTIKVIEGSVELTYYETGDTKTVEAGYKLTATQSGLGSASSFDIYAEKENWDSFYEDLDNLQVDSDDSAGQKLPIKLPKISNCISKIAYGCENCHQLSVLREFRDKCLLSSQPGRLCVAAYYKISYLLSDIMTDNELLRSAVRYVFLEPVVFTLDSTRSVWSN